MQYICLRKSNLQRDERNDGEDAIKNTGVPEEYLYTAHRIAPYEKHGRLFYIFRPTYPYISVYVPIFIGILSSNLLHGGHSDALPTVPTIPVACREE